MRTFLIAIVIAILAGIIYQKVVNENMEIKEVTDYAKDMVNDMTGQVKDAIEDDVSRKEAIDNALNNVEDFTNEVSEKVREETAKKAQEVAESILAESVATDSKITCDVLKSTIEKIKNDEELTTKEEKYIDGFYKTMLNTSDITKEDAFNTLELIYCK